MAHSAPAATGANFAPAATTGWIRVGDELRVSRNHRTAKGAKTTEIYRAGDALRASRNYGTGGALRASHNHRTIGRK